MQKLEHTLDIATRDQPELSQLVGLPCRRPGRHYDNTCAIVDMRSSMKPPVVSDARGRKAQQRKGYVVAQSILAIQKELNGGEKGTVHHSQGGCRPLSPWGQAPCAISFLASEAPFPSVAVFIKRSTQVARARLKEGSRRRQLRSSARLGRQPNGRRKSLAERVASWNLPVCPPLSSGNRSHERPVLLDRRGP